MDNSNKSAYPQHELDSVTGKVSQVQSRGLSKRERFAMAAMQGLLSGDDEKLPAETISRQAVIEADALLKELEERQ